MWAGWWAAESADDFDSKAEIQPLIGGETRSVPLPLNNMGMYLHSHPCMFCYHIKVDNTVDGGHLVLKGSLCRDLKSVQMKSQQECTIEVFGPKG